MLHAANAAHLLASTGASGAAMDQDGKRRAVAGRFLRIVAVDDEHPAVKGRGAANEVAGCIRRMGEQGQSEAALAAIGQRNGVVQVLVGHDGRDRAEGLDVVDGLGHPRVVGAKQDRL